VEGAACQRRHHQSDQRGLPLSGRASAGRDQAGRRQSGTRPGADAWCGRDGASSEAADFGGLSLCDCLGYCRDRSGGLRRGGAATRAQAQAAGLSRAGRSAGLPDGLRGRAGAPHDQACFAPARADSGASGHDPVGRAARVRGSGRTQPDLAGSGRENEAAQGACRERGLRVHPAALGRQWPR
jgi:hypothetical protein